jgi:hypothetical protein
MDSGVYLIKNNVNGKVYIGSSINVKNRIYKHKWLLKNNKHDNGYLQKSFNKYGGDAFEYLVLEYCDINDLIITENKLITEYNSTNSEYGYNLATVNEFRRNNFNIKVKINNSKYNLNYYGNFKKFSLTNIKTEVEVVFESLVEAANYLLINGFAKGNPRNIRMKLSCALREVIVNNGNKGSIRKTCYKHKFKIIN